MQAPLPASRSAPPFVRRWTPQRVVLATLGVVAVVVGFYLIYRFANVLFVLFVAAMLATAMRPAVRWFEQRQVPPWAGVLLIYLVLALITAGGFATFVPRLIDQGSHLV